MDKWRGKVAIVTGASSGIGAAIARELVHHGLTVVAVTRRLDRIEKLSEELTKEPGKLVGIKTDLRKEDQISEVFSRIELEFGGADILVNNSGVGETEKFLEGNIEKWREILEVNVLALCICSKEFLLSAKKRNLEQGHIVNINSVLGHIVSSGRAPMYQASKHAVTAICQSLRREIAAEGSPLKVTSISPGFTRTEMIEGTSTGAILNSTVLLEPKDVAEAIINVLSASSISQICELILTPVPTAKLLY